MLFASGLDSHFTFMETSTEVLLLTLVCSAKSFAISSFSLAGRSCWPVWMDETGHREVFCTGQTLTAFLADFLRHQSILVLRLFSSASNFSIFSISPCCFFSFATQFLQMSLFLIAKRSNDVTKF